MLRPFLVLQRGLLTALAAVAAPVAIAETPQRVAPIEAVAQQYYEAVKLAQASNERDSKRYSEASEAKKPTRLASATGIVVDRRGRPVADAAVEIEVEKNDKTIGRGKSDAQGRFSIKLSQESYEALSIVVTKDGYMRFAMGSVYGGIVDYRVKLDQTLDDAFFTRFRAETDPTERYWLLLEIVGARQFDSEIKKTFPHIGDFRQELLVLINSRLFDKPDDREHDIPAEGARTLLYYWQDPADEAIVARLAKKRGKVNTPLVGETPEEACQEYVENHFGDTPPQQRTLNHLSNPIVSPDGNHAVVEFSVMYKHWGYDELLFLTRQDGEWKVNLAMEWRRMCHISHGEE